MVRQQEVKLSPQVWDFSQNFTKHQKSWTIFWCLKNWNFIHKRSFFKNLIHWMKPKLLKIYQTWTSGTKVFFMKLIFCSVSISISVSISVTQAVQVVSQISPAGRFSLKQQEVSYFRTKHLFTLTVFWTTNAATAACDWPSRLSIKKTRPQTYIYHWFVLIQTELMLKCFDAVFKGDVGFQRHLVAVRGTAAENTLSCGGCWLVHIRFMFIQSS